MPPRNRTLRERVGALRNLPPFLEMVWQTSPLLTLANLVSPAVPGVAAGRHALRRQADHRRGGALAGLPGHRTAWATGGERAPRPPGWLLVLESALAVLSDVLGRVVSLVDALLSERFTNATSIRLMEHAATLDLEDFEDSELQDQLERARRQTSGRMALMAQLFGQAQDIVTVVSFAAGLIVTRRG